MKSDRGACSILPNRRDSIKIHYAGSSNYIVRCNKFDRQKNLEGLEVGATVRLVRQPTSADHEEEMPMLVFREGSLDVGEVPVRMARSISGNDHFGSVTGFVDRANGRAPVVCVTIPEVSRTRSSRSYSAVRVREGLNTGQILLLILIVVAGLLLGFLKAATGGKSVHVHGYTRADGTTVSRYDRALPGTK